MALYEREQQYLSLLTQREYSVKELSEFLFVSEPTVRRDIVALKQKELVTCQNGVVKLRVNAADKRIPMLVRYGEHNSAKMQIGERAARLIKDGDVVMLDASTTAYHILPFLRERKSLFVITSGVRTAMDLACMGIRTLCVGGELLPDSLSFVGADAERTLKGYNADIAFFSCRGVSEDGRVTDNSIAENSIRQLMIRNAAKSYLLCDGSKLGKTCLHTLCSLKELDGVISDKSCL